MLIAFLLFCLFAALILTMTATTFYGICISFNTKWYFGLAALTVPGFALVVGAAKLFAKKNILE